jgi:hypothetical protein
VAAAQKKTISPESGPTSIFRLTRINQELPDESGPHQTTPESKLEQVTCQNTGTSKKDEPEKTDDGTNEKSKLPTRCASLLELVAGDVLHVDQNLDSPAAPVIIAGSFPLTVAAGRKFDMHIANTGRLFCSRHARQPPIQLPTSHTYSRRPALSFSTVSHTLAALTFLLNLL